MIAAISILIAICGAILLLILFIRIRDADKEQKLNRHRSTAMGFADLLVYAAVVEEGVIVGKNGSLMAAWIFRGEDTASSTDTERERVSFRINQALSRLGNGWMIHVDAVRKPAQGYSDKAFSNYPDPITAAIDAERREVFEKLGTLYESCFIVTLTYLPPILAQRKFIELMFDDDSEAQDGNARTQGLLEYFQRECINFESRLSSVFKLSRLQSKKHVNEDGTTTTHDDFLQWLQLCITGLDHAVVLPTNPMYLDTMLGGQDFWGGVVPKIGRNFVQVVSIEGFPLESSPGM